MQISKKSYRKGFKSDFEFSSVQALIGIDSKIVSKNIFSHLISKRTIDSSFHTSGMIKIWLDIQTKLRKFKHL